MTRTFEEIGRGLAAARPARPIRAGERLHVLGVGGSAAAAAAILARAAGAEVTGCDSGGPSPYSAAAEAAGVPLTWEHDPGHVAGPEGARVDRIAVTKAITSVHPEHPELVAAAGAGIPAESVQQVIADAAVTHRRRLVGVAGTHGKSTTTGWLVHLLAADRRDPSAFVGALLPADLAGGSASVARIGRGPEFVVEADEYAGNFDPYRPRIGVLVTCEWDHPDVFADEAAVAETFVAWIRRFEAGGDPDRPVLVANVGDPGVRRVVDALRRWSGRLVAVELVDGAAADLATARAGHAARYATAAGPAGSVAARIVRTDDTGAEIEIAGLDGTDAPVRARVGLPGRHMVVDGLAAAAGAAAAGASAHAIAVALGTFRGVGRRLELKGDVGGVIVLDDYGHHPSAIAATMAAVRQRYPGRRLWAVYEPLTYHRTAAMLDGFADVLATADRAAVVDIWAGRDPDTTIASAEGLAQAISARSGAPALATGSPEATAARLAGLVEPGDVVLVMGGGRSYVAAERLVELLLERVRP